MHGNTDKLYDFIGFSALREFKKSAKKRIFKVHLFELTQVQI